MERWDAYDASFHRLDGISLVRGEPIPEGCFHLVCDVIVQHTDGSFLIMRRDLNKSHGGLWEATAGGSALQGESAPDCARRELWEETGIVAEQLAELGRITSGHSHYVEYYCRIDWDKNTVRLQPGETMDYRWVNGEALRSMRRDQLLTERMRGFMSSLFSTRGAERAKVLNIGSLNLDYVYQVEHFVQPGETLSALRQAVHPGGKGLNQSVALSRAGTQVFHAGCLGRGGDSLRELLEDNGVDTRYLRPVDSVQGNAVIQVNPEGQNCILIFGGSNRELTGEQIAETLSHFSPGDWLILQNEINALPHIVDSAYHRGMRIVLNPSPFDENLRGLDYSRINWLLLNQIEAFQLSGSDEPEKAWQILHGKYPSLSLLITLGERGSVCFTEKEEVFQAAFPVRAVDTTAAGDTYTGYFIAGLTDGLSLQESMRLASMASAISVTRPGAAPSIPHRRDVEDALKDAEKGQHNP